MATKPINAAKSAKSGKVAKKSPKAKLDLEAFAVAAGIEQSVEKFSKKSIIFRQGDDADAVFYIRKGKVQITVVSYQGKEGVIGMLDAGEFFGEG